MARLGRCNGYAVGGADVSSELLDNLRELNPDALLADGLEGALIGYTLNAHMEHVAVYSHQKCIDVLVPRDGMEPEDAEEFLSFNTLCAYVGKHGPIYIQVYGT